MVGLRCDKVDHWIFEEYRVDQGDLALFRQFYAVMAIALYFPTAMWAPSIPAYFWAPPPGFASLLDGPPSWWVLAVLNGLFLLFCVGLFVGDNTPVASLGVGVTLLALNNVSYSFGKINHDIALPLTAILLAFSGWGGDRSIDAKVSTPAPLRPWCLALLALVLGIAMFTAAWPKILSGWLSIDTHAVKNTAIGFAERPQEGVGRALAVQYTPDWLWEIQDWAAVGMEALFVVAAYRLKWFRAILVLALLFHMGVLIVLFIPFSFNVVVYAAFFPLRKLLKPALAMLPMAALMVVALCDFDTPRDFISQSTVMLGGLLTLYSLFRRL